jgi:sugar porter (SP) family MFS transporter
MTANEVLHGESPTVYEAMHTPIKPGAAGELSAFDLSATVQPRLALFATVLVTLLQPFQFGWSLSQVNLSTFSTQSECDARPVPEGECLMFPGHSSTDWSFVVNAWIVGGMVGSLGCGYLSERFGRKRVLLANCAFMLAGAVVQAAASSVAVYVAGRFLAGVASGCATGMIGGYINEVSPPHLRNSLGICLQISLSIGILCVVCTFFFANTASGWRWIGGFPVVNAVLFLALAPWVMVESPVWLIANGKQLEAERVLARLYGEENVGLALQWMETSSSSSDGETTGMLSEDCGVVEDASDDGSKQSVLMALVSPEFRLQLIIAVIIAAVHQLSGINAVFYYSSDIFKQAGISDDRIGSVIVNAVNVLPTFCTSYLAERFGNRRLLLVGMTDMFVSAIGMTVALSVSSPALSILFTATYVAGFAFSIGPLVYVVTADLFPSHLRSTALSLCICCNWCANLVIGIAFPYIADALDDLSFLPFVVILALFVLFTYKLVPETAGKTNQEIQAHFQRRRHGGDTTSRV